MHVDVVVDAGRQEPAGRNAVADGTPDLDAVGNLVPRRDTALGTVLQPDFPALCAVVR